MNIVQRMLENAQASLGKQLAQDLREKADDYFRRTRNRPNLACAPAHLVTYFTSYLRTLQRIDKGDAPHVAYHFYGMSVSFNKYANGVSVTYVPGKLTT